MLGDCTLPSSDAACALVRGDPGAAVKIALTTIARAGLIYVGMGLFGGGRLRAAIGGAIAIEAFVIAWAMTHQES